MSYDFSDRALPVGGILLPNGVLVEPFGSSVRLRNGSTVLLTVTAAGAIVAGAQGSAYTQTYATANKTHANLTAADLTDNTTGAAGGTLGKSVV